MVHRHRKWGWHNGKQWVLVHVLGQCEHFYMVLHFPFGPSPSPSLCTGPAQCEYIITGNKHTTHVIFPLEPVAFQFYMHDLLLQKITMLLRTKNFSLPAQNSCHNKYFITT